jgi:UDP-GlcNAc3NAcA epimerase
MKLVTVVGARPQFIKAATISRAIAQYNERSPVANLREVIIHTGQHYDANMSDIFFDEMKIPKPNYSLGIGGGSHGAMTGRQLKSIETILLEEKPNYVLVYGDTNSTLAGALAAAKLHIPVVHIESGLRSFNRDMPEEINRILTDHISTLLFAPTGMAKINLVNEGVPPHNIYVTGDVMYDAALFYQNSAKKPVWFDELCLGDGFVLSTIHRAENTNDLEKLGSIFKGLKLSRLPVILPLHPRTRDRISSLAIDMKNIHIVDPVGYFEMVWLEKNAEIIATDSGGVQKEAFFHGKPCVTLRDETEWVELVSSGFNILTGASEQKIVAALNRQDWPDVTGALYGEGDSAIRILELVVCHFFEQGGS